MAELDRTETQSLYEVLRRAAWTWSEPTYAEKGRLYAARHADLDVNLRVPPYAAD